MNRMFFKSTYRNFSIANLRINSTLLLTGLAFFTLCHSLNFADANLDYSKKIQPIFDSYCVTCHNQDDNEGGFRLDSYAQLMKGGESGPAITAGVASSSRLFLMASKQLQPVMPPDDAEGPTADELATLADWIDSGALAPDGETATPFVLRTPKINVNQQVQYPITAIACAPNGKLTATASFQGVTLSDNAGNALVKINKFPGKINSLQFSADGSQLVVASGLTGVYGQATIIQTDRLLFPGTNHTASPNFQSIANLEKRVVQGHTDTLYAAILSPDQTRLATAGYDKKICIWDATTGELLRTLTGHNGAIFDLQFIANGQMLISASADETAKVWDVVTGQRLDTLGQPEGEVYAVDTMVVGPDTIAIAISADNRLRAWKLSLGKANESAELIATRFIDESPLIAMALTPDQLGLIVVSEAGNIKLLETGNWKTTDTLESLPDAPSDISITADGKVAIISLMDGTLVRRELIGFRSKIAETQNSKSVQPIYLELPSFPEAKTYREQDLLNNDQKPHTTERNSIVLGTISNAGQVDQYCWHVNAGEVWMIEANARTVASGAEDGPENAKQKQLDPIIKIQNPDGTPVIRTRLQAVRDSYFTFRGKDSNQSGDFRLFAWQEMNLNDYLYAAGEVTKLWMHPRGPDSGFDVYPGEGNRWTYFGTSHITHALGEPAYIVRPLQAGETPLPNGLPVFEIPYQNDDDPSRLAGKNSKIAFLAPHQGTFTIAVTDTRGEGGKDFAYELRIRPAQPSFNASCSKISQPLLPGIGREFWVKVDRLDEFDEAVEFRIEGLPPGVRYSSPIIIEPGQRSAYGTVWIDEETQWPENVEPKLVATGTINGKTLTKDAGSLGVLTKATTAKVKPIIQILSTQPTLDATGDVSRQTQQQDNQDRHQPLLLQVQRGQTISARVLVEREKDFGGEISFGNAVAGRNTAHGVYVDNIGLNGLLLLKDMNQRDFFITATPQAALGKRPFFLKAEVDGGLTTVPILLEVVP